MLLLASCNPWYDFYHRRELERYYDGAAAVRLHVDWEHLFETPELMTVFLAKNGDSITNVYTTQYVDSFTFFLDAGDYRLMVMNETFSDYETMSFHETNSIKKMYAKSNPMPFYPQYVYAPGVTGVAIDSFTITQEQIDSHRQFVPYKQTVTPDTLLVQLFDTVYDMTCRLNVYVHTDGYPYLHKMTGNITGLADGFNLSSFRRNTTSGTLYLNEWQHYNTTLTDAMRHSQRRRLTGNQSSEAKISQISHLELEGETDSIIAYIDSIYADDGLPHDWLVCHTSTFGLRAGKERTRDRQPQDNILTLYYTLRDGKTHKFEYEVGKLLRYRDIDEDTFSGQDMRHLVESGLQLDLDLVIDMPLPYPVLPETDTIASSFDVTVQEWEEGEIINIKL